MPTKKLSSEFVIPYLNPISCLGEYLASMQILFNVETFTCFLSSPSGN